MRHALSFNENQYNFDIEALKQFSLMNELNYTYLSILLQRARFSSVKPGQRLKASYESEYIIYLIKGHGSIKSGGEEQFIDAGYKAPIFVKDGKDEVVFTDDSLIVRIERPLYEIFNKSSSFNKVLY